MVYIQPTYKECFIYGFIDGSLREYTTTAKYRLPGKLISLYSGFHTSPITSVCTSHNGNYIVTGSDDGVIIVSKLIISRKHELKVLGSLSGHHDTILSISISLNYGIIVSGSNDSAAIVWSLHDLCYIRSLIGHSEPVTCVDINDATGDIFTLSGNCLRMYNVNGVCLSAINMCTISTCTTLTATNCVDYLDGIVCITGHEDGSIRLWTIQHPTIETQQADPIKPTPVILFEKVVKTHTFTHQSSQIFKGFRTALRSLKRSSSKDQKKDAPLPAIPITPPIQQKPLERSLIVYSELAHKNGDESTHTAPIISLKTLPRTLVSIDKENVLIIWAPN